MDTYFLSDYNQLPTDPGVYQFLDKKNHVLYVGKARNLKNRVSSYLTNGSKLGDRTRLMINQAAKIAIQIVESEFDALILEAAFIKKYFPKYNIRLTDGKAYPLIRITTNQEYPAILIARRPDDKQSMYFGPYPSSGAMKMVLKTLRRIFPYQSVAHHPKRVCLYHHLNLCPCPPVFNSQELKKEYKKNIKHIIQFLEGHSQKVLKELEKEREYVSKSEQFEQAQKAQKQIDAIHYILSPAHKPFEYEMNPNLRTDLRQNELDSLKKELNKLGLSLQKLERIECYDISNIQGNNATGSLVVFVNGEPDKNQYRRFRIRRDYGGKPNDFAMHQEVLSRRLKHTEWKYPDLLIIDGGKGQVSKTMEILKEGGLTIPLIGLAKRLETIVVPIQNSKENYKELTLPYDSDASKLIRRIRDEAHRFAITYHRKLRSKSFLPAQ